jgi:hypothetical protein
MGYRLGNALIIASSPSSDNSVYDSNKESAWYDSHKSKQDTYVGYWCFEGLALAVALGLEANRLRGLKYIPEDLIPLNKSKTKTLKVKLPFGITIESSRVL